MPRGISSPLRRGRMARLSAGGAGTSQHPGRRRNVGNGRASTRSAAPICRRACPLPSQPPHPTPPLPRTRARPTRCPARAAAQSVALRYTRGNRRAAQTCSCRGAPRAARARLPAPRKGGRASAEGARLQRPTECVRARGVGGARQCDGVAARQASKQHLAIWRKPPRGMMKREANEARATLYPTQSLAACRLSPRAPRPCVCSDLRSQIRSKGNAPTQLVACRLSPRALPRLYTRAFAQMSHVRSHVQSVFSG